MQMYPLLHLCIALIGAPLLPSIITRTKSWFAGRTGPPLMQIYFDVAKLLRKGAVYSETSTWVFAAAPLVGLTATLVALLFVPLGRVPGLVRFDGDLVLVAYLLGLVRFFTVVAALDTGSSFEAMGASREVQVSALAEPALLLALVVLAVDTGQLSLSTIFVGLAGDGGPAIPLVFVTLLVVFLAENSRIPVDDPTTHLELTMIHEVMILDHSGPDLALIELTNAYRMWILGALVVGTLHPLDPGPGVIAVFVGVAGLALLAILVGIIESSMARLRLPRLPQLLVSATALAAIGLIVMVLT